MFFGQNINDIGFTKIVTPPTAPAADVADLKALLRLSVDDGEYIEDSYLDQLILAASGWAALYLNRSLITTELVREYDIAQTHNNLVLVRMPPRYISLPYPPLQTVDRVYSITDDGTETEITNFYTDDFSTPPRIDIKSCISGRDIGFLRIEYTAGYGDTSADVPALIQQGILQHAAYMYEHRGDCEATEAAQKSGAVGMYAMYKVGYV